MRSRVVSPLAPKPGLGLIALLVIVVTSCGRPRPIDTVDGDSDVDSDVDADADADADPDHVVETGMACICSASPADGASSGFESLGVFALIALVAFVALRRRVGR